MSYHNQQPSNLFLRTDYQGYGGGLTPLVSPVAKFTFDSLKTTGSKPCQAKISLKRDSSGKKKRQSKLSITQFFRKDLVRNIINLMHVTKCENI